MSCGKVVGSNKKIATVIKSKSERRLCQLNEDAHFVEPEDPRSRAPQGGNIVLIIDDSTDSSNLFIESGYTPIRYSHWGINTGQTNEVGAHLKAYRYALVWCDFPKLGNKARPYAHMTCLINWANLCRQLGIPFVLFGSFGKKWNDPQLLAAVDSGTLQKRHHRLCHFGITVSGATDVPSSTCFVTAATVPLPAHPCRCEVPQAQHKMDLKTEPGPSTTKELAGVQSRLLAHLLRSLFLDVNRNTCAYPTQNDTENLYKTNHNDVGQQLASQLVLDQGPTAATPTPTSSTQQSNWSMKEADTADAYTFSQQVIDKISKGLRK